MNLNTFTTVFRDAAENANDAWGYATLPDDFYDVFARRIPLTIREEIGRGILDGHVIVDGYRFRLPGLGPKKGPYAFFSKNRGPGIPSPNWEYFVQLAEYLRIRRTVAPTLKVGFEDGLMDVSVRDGDRLLWYVEAKEKASQAVRLVDALAAYGPQVDSATVDRGNDPLQKAKYLIRHRPEFLTVVAIDWRRDFTLRYPREDAFELVALSEPPDWGEHNDARPVDQGALHA